MFLQKKLRIHLLKLRIHLFLRKFEKVEKLRIHLFLRKLKKVDISKLIEGSNYIQSKCVNDLRKNESLGQEFWWHSLPLKSEVESFLKPENWDIPEAEIAKITEVNERLMKYADDIVEIAYLQKEKSVNTFLNKVTDLLPPWIVFPLYDAYTIGWRMGRGESYVDVYIGFIHSLNDEEFKIYNRAYPQPDYMGTKFAFSLNQVNYKLRKKG